MCTVRALHTTQIAEPPLIHYRWHATMPGLKIELAEDDAAPASVL